MHDLMMVRNIIRVKYATPESQNLDTSTMVTMDLNRQTDIYCIDRNKSHHRRICHSNKRDICTCIYKNVSLLKSYDNRHGMTNN